ncbi:MAG: DegT/DnrJ/EryC1/StrS family aminotransferase, partial [Candidatus Altiarchaeales archaeon]|nr:DegT/DnrJ/EryC1/StrS family aminotransferase [Candidatus Altiarchaeales archaeon]
SCFSFYPTKNMTTGEGGMILTGDEEVAERCRLYINHGMPERYRHVSLGFNYRMTNMQAALGLCQLDRLDEFNNKRIKNAGFLSDSFGGLAWLKTPVVPKGCRHVFHQYTVRLREGRDRFIKYLSDNGVGYGVYYPGTMCDQPLYHELGLYEGFGVADRLAREVVSLPVHPSVSSGDLDYICDKISGFGR